MTDEELRNLVAETTRAVAKNSRAVAKNSRAIREMREESDRRWEESQKQWQESREEILASRRETDRLITSLERRLGEIGNSLGLYTESMFQPSLTRILREQFGMTVIAAPQKFQIDGADYEVDVVGHGGAGLPRASRQEAFWHPGRRHDPRKSTHSGPEVGSLPGDGQRRRV